MRGIRRLFRLERGEPPNADEVDVEINAHLAMRIDELIAAGMTAEEARAEALRQFGDVAGTREAILSLDRGQWARARAADWWHGLAQEVRYAVRQLRRSPGFAASTALTLALGLGATGAIFSVVERVLARPLPFADSDRLVRVWPTEPATGPAERPISIPDLEDWRRAQHDFSALGGYWYRAGQSGADLTGFGAPEWLPVAQVTTGFFEALGVRPELGRLPSANEMREGGDHVVVISDGLWRRRFGGDPSIIGRTIQLSGLPYVVVGVMPPSMRFPGDGPDAWLAALYQPQSSTPWKDRATRWLSVVGRLAPGVTPQQAQRDLSTVQRRLAEQYPDADHGWTAACAVPLLDTIVGDARPALLIVLGAVACLLLIACVNIAALLLARVGAREREFAVRTALGAPGSRVLRQVLTESVVLALAGGVVGVGIALLAEPVLLHLAAGQVPRLAGAPGTQWLAALVTLPLALVAGVALGLPPGLQLLSIDPQRALGEAGGGRGSTAGRGRFRARQMMVVAETALAVMLVCGAGLMAKSFRKLVAVDAGFRPDHALAVALTLRDTDNDDTRMARVYRQILERVRATPGVVAAGAAKVLPLQGDEETWPFAVAGGVIPPPGERPTVTVNHVSDGYFQALGTPMVAGREFAPSDTAGGPDVAIVNETFVRRYMGVPPSAAIDRALIFGTSRVPIVGVVRDLHEHGLDAAPQAAAYVAAPQNLRSSLTLVVRTRGDPASMTAPVERAIWSVDKDQAIRNVTTLDAIVYRTVARARLTSVLLACFGALGLLLGALGIAGVVAYTVSQRRQEIGVRVALGATRREVLEVVVGRGLALALAGVATGLAASLVATRAMRAVLFGIAPADVSTYAEVAGVLLLVAMAAAYLPARRAMAVDPVEALRVG